SGGVDSLLLATLAHRAMPGRLVAAHAVSPAVPGECTQRVRREAASQGWRVEYLSTGEFGDERYLENPFDRCYFCKAHLYGAMEKISWTLSGEFGFVPPAASGANTDDLEEHRPGLDAAREFGVRHPFVEADISKADIRAMARELGLSFADVPASPCLASRVYTGTRVTPERLSAVAFAEEFLKKLLGAEVLRCRIREDAMLVEMLEAERHKATPQALQTLARALRDNHPGIRGVELDPECYRPGRAFVSG
ncbi:MAG: ATPase, partial [Thermodesulfobacteriota bacterium]